MNVVKNERDNRFDVQIPWSIEDDTELTLAVYDRRLQGSKTHFIRFDLYPLYAPSHLKRHHGFWDLPLKYIQREKTPLSLNDGKLIVKNGRHAVHLKPVWKGDMDFTGYSMVHVSLWDFAKEPPVQLTVKSSQHVLMQGTRDLPLEHVYLPITQRCNLSCDMCMRHNPEYWETDDVEPNVLNPLLEAAPFLHSVFVGGIGEPLLYENLYKVLSELKRRMPEDSQAGFNTNGTLMTQSVSSRLIGLGVNWICFSVDGATRLTYERIRPGANFDEVIKNMANTVEAARTSGRKNLWLTANYVMQKENALEIPAFTRLAGSLGLNAVSFSHLRDFKKGEFHIVDKDTVEPLLEQALEIGSMHGVKITFPSLQPHEELRCPFMQSAYVWLSGEIVPCCRMLKGAYPGQIKTFGNVKNESLMGIWNSTEYREFRHGVLTRDFPDACKGCNYITGLFG